MNGKTVFADLHIHIGSTASGRPVKITASKQMTIQAILKEAAERKGLGLIGVIDCHVPEVLEELRRLIEGGEAVELAGGGIRYHETTLLLGTEMEVYDDTCRGPIHVLCYFPDLETMGRFSRWMGRFQKNIALSSQRSYVKVKDLQREVKALEGLFIPAHIFTPYKSVYGKGVDVFMAEVLDLDLVDAVELGLSADTAMASQLVELDRFVFLTNSDAHSLASIGREYQQLWLEEADFKHLKEGLQKGVGVMANFGLDPKLGKYYREVSARIHWLSSAQRHRLARPPHEEGVSPMPQRKRPPYKHQIPLQFIPGLGPARINRLIETFGSEMYVLHYARLEELESILPSDIARSIVKARIKEVSIEAGGRGRYGKVSY